LLGHELSVERVILIGARQLVRLLLLQDTIIIMRVNILEGEALRSDSI
jgi:hypothetical protein